MTDYLKQDISLWPFATKNGIRVLTGAERISANIATSLLLQKGENPAEPNAGFSPDLFSPITRRDVNLFCYQAKDMVLRNNSEIEEVAIYPDTANVDLNNLSVIIEFRTKTSESGSFSFVFSEYINLLQNKKPSSLKFSLKRKFL